MFKRRNKLSPIERIRHFISPPKGYKRAWQYLIWRIKRRPGTPEFIARGFAIGVAINFWPVLFTHLIGGVFLCWAMGGDLIAMFIGTLFGNPWTFAIVYPIMYKIGKILLGLRPHRVNPVETAGAVWTEIWPIESWHSLWIGLKEIIFPMILGGFLLALPCALFAYYIARNAVRVYQGNRRRAIMKQFVAVEADIERHNPHIKP